ncbi:beta-N-acetylhexosaminidase [Synchytrium endobioticum]|uniref:beta-N-acetylhexosaminidase n=1 Tax=Synchytrium endobioticum TaxID=286115 RepID=A0A507DJ65_9FUNG|nr:beta-N-acetylhexosaminidase [Synchytrium endobioticum]
MQMAWMPIYQPMPPYIIPIIPASQNPLNLVPIPYLTRLDDQDEGEDDHDHDQDIIISPTSSENRSKSSNSTTSCTHRSFSLSSNTTIHYYDTRLSSTALRLSRALGIGGIATTLAVIEKEHDDQMAHGDEHGHGSSAIADVPPPGIHLLITPSFSHTHIPLSNPTLTAECYELCVRDSHTITIKAADPKGVFYGCTSLEQMFETSAASIPLVTIVDGPRFEWRGCHLDCARHFMDVPFIKRFLELLAYHKINRFHWHLTDDQGWRWSRSYVSDVVALAGELHIEVVPEVELPGHCTAALARYADPVCAVQDSHAETSYPDLGCTGGPYTVSNRWGIHADVFCAGNENVFVFLEGVLAEVTALFPSKYIHIGGDECPKDTWEACHRCQKRVSEHGLRDSGELQSWFVNRIAGFLRSKGKIVIGWDEIHEGGLPEDVIVQSWRDWNGAVGAVRQGHQAITSPVSHCYFDWGVKYINLERVYAFDPIPPGIAPSEESLIMGSEACMWTEDAPRNTVLGKVFPRLLALATKLWTLKQRTDGIPFPDFFETVTMYHIPLRLKRLGVECSDGMSESFKARA